MLAAALLFVAALLLSPSRATAQSPVAAELSFVRSFIGTCLHHFPDIERVKQTANALKWPEIKNPDVRGMLGPADPKAKWDGWMMKSDGHSFLVGISENSDQGRAVRACTLAADKIDLAKVYATLESLVSLRKQLDFNEDGQRNQLWVYARDVDRYALMATDGSPMQMNTLSLAITNARPRAR